MNPTPATPACGGCQCGAVRYEIHAALEKIHLCHCRMCQRAMGNAFAALAGSPRDALRWTQGTPKYYASSSLARRGFCADCGTPLSFEYLDASRVYVTIGSLDDPAAAAPGVHYGAESWLPWLHLQDGLAREPTADDPRLRNMQILQSAIAPPRIEF